MAFFFRCIRAVDDYGHWFMIINILIDNDTKFKTHIDIKLNIDIIPPHPMPGPLQAGPGGGMGWGGQLSISYRYQC